MAPTGRGSAALSAADKRRRPPEFCPDTTIVVASMPCRCTRANRVAAFAGCSLMQPWEAGPPRRLIS